MSHNLYAEIEAEHREAYYYSDKRDPAEIENYPYDRAPSVGAKVIRSSNWLPDWITNGAWEKFTPSQTIMYAVAIADQLSKLDHMTRLDRMNEMERLINIVSWLTYWGRQNIGVRGGP